MHRTRGSPSTLIFQEFTDGPTFRTYDSAGRIRTVTGASAGTHTYNYLENSANLIERIDPPPNPGYHGIATGTVYKSWESHRDVLDVHNNAWISAFDYSVNNLGQRTNVHAWGTMTGGYTYGYNSAGEVETSQHAVQSDWHRAYRYDTIGNIEGVAVGSVTPPTEANWASNSKNQYTEIGDFDDFVYDADGNTTTGVFAGTSGLETGSLTWDAENRLVTSVVGGVTATYAYDYQGRRIRKSSFGTNLWNLYDGWNLAAEYSGTTLLRAHTWGLDLSGSLQGAGGVGGLLSIRVASGHAVGIYYPMFDGNGNVTDYFNETAGIVAHHEYDAFGNIIHATGSHIVHLPFRFSTKYHDNYELTQFSYYGYRYYQPFIGKWPSRDPIEERGGINLYGFVNNNAANSIDILGLAFKVKAGTAPQGNNQGTTMIADTKENKFIFQEYRIENHPEGKKCCAFVSKVTEYDLIVSTYAPAALPGYTENGIKFLGGHEARRVDVYKRGYDGILSKIKPRTLNMPLCCTNEGEAKTKLEDWTAKVMLDHFTTFTNYVLDQQKGISIEMDPSLVKYIEVNGKRLVDGSSYTHKVTSPGQVEYDDEPKTCD